MTHARPPTVRPGRSSQVAEWTPYSGVQSNTSGELKHVNRPMLTVQYRTSMVAAGSIGKSEAVQDNETGVEFGPSSTWFHHRRDIRSARFGVRPQGRRRAGGLRRILYTVCRRMGGLVQSGAVVLHDLVCCAVPSRSARIIQSQAGDEACSRATLHLQTVRGSSAWVRGQHSNFQGMGLWPGIPALYQITYTGIAP